MVLVITLFCFVLLFGLNQYIQKNNIPTNTIDIKLATNSIIAHPARE
jgi:hypothetical protein